VASDRPVKIGRGREESHRSQEAAPREESQDATLAESRPAPEKSNDPTRPASGKKNDKRRRGRRGRDRQDLPEEMTASNESEDRLPPEGDQLRHNKSNGSGENGEEKAPSFISKLFPPPTTLIKDSLSRYKQMEPGVPVEEKPAFEESIFEHPTPDTEVERDNEE